MNMVRYQAKRPDGQPTLVGILLEEAEIHFMVGIRLKHIRLTIPALGSVMPTFEALQYQEVQSVDTPLIFAKMALLFSDIV